MHIRRSKSRDRTAVLKLARRFSLDIGLHNLPLLADHIGTDRVVVACQDNDRPVGFVYAYLKGKGISPYSPGRNHLYVAAICVDSDNRKKGIASALMKELVKSNSHRKICGQILCSNEAGRKLYKKNGFNELYVVFSKEAFKEPVAKVAATSKERLFRSYGAEVNDGVVTLYRGGNVSEDTLRNLRYGDYLSATEHGEDATGNQGASSYGKNVVKFELLIDDIEVTGAGEFQYKGGSESLSGGKKYPVEIYKAYNDYNGLNLTAKEIDSLSTSEVRNEASMGLTGGTDEFDSLTKNKYKPKVAAKPFEITSMAGGIKCPYCGSEGFDKQEFDEHLKYCQEYLKIKDTPLARPLMKNSSVDVFYIVTKPSTGDTLKTTLFEVKTEDLPKYFEDFQNGEVEGIFGDKFVAETVAKSLLEAIDTNPMGQE